jgi:hypothetical protein
MRCLHDRCVLQVHGHRKCQRLGIVPDDEHRPDRHVLAANHTEEVDQRNRTPHRQTQSRVVPVAWIHPAIPVEEEAVRGPP